MYSLDKKSLVVFLEKLEIFKGRKKNFLFSRKSFNSYQKRRAIHKIKSQHQHIIGPSYRALLTDDQ